ncbi:MAG: hypothetical protein ABGY72_19410 [bacterium]
MICPPDDSGRRHVDHARRLVDESGGACIDLVSPVESDLAENVLGLTRAGV